MYYTHTTHSLHTTATSPHLARNVSINVIYRLHNNIGIMHESELVLLQAN